MTCCDVLVVGGGPAGSSTAADLARRGRHVILADKATFPRDKICGEGVSPEAWTLLADLGMDARVRDLSPWTLRGMRLHAPDGTSFAGRYAGRTGFAARRLRLDAALLDAARAGGADVRTATRAEPGPVEDAPVRLVTAGGDDSREVRARVVVAADGRGGGFTSRLGLLHASQNLRKFAVRGHWENVGGLEDLGEMHVGGGGYCGVAPLSASAANVAFVLDVSEMPSAGGRIEEFYLDTLGRWPTLNERLARATLLAPPQATGPLASQARRLVRGNVLLVGDAAGFYDPFTGEGVTLALRSAALAAEAIDDHLRDGRSLDVYERRRRAATTEKFRFNRLLQQVVARPALANAMARKLQRRPDIADVLVGVAGDFVPASAAFRLRTLFDLLRA